jgi:hypothetical protein
MGSRVRQADHSFVLCTAHLWLFTKILDATQIACIRSSLGMDFRNEKRLMCAELR